ncbi:MAG: hypothetical protein B7Z77_11260, partial [Acidocella sp. 20-58-15]
MNTEVLLLALIIVAVLLAAVLAWASWRAADQSPEKLRLLLEQNLAANRAEAETTRIILAAMEGRLAAAIQSGTTEALSKAFEQINTAVQA